MPNIKSAEKRVKVIEAKTKVNNSKKSALKTSIKKAKQSIESAGNDAGTLLQGAVKSIDKAASDGILHKNTAARKKSKLQKSFNKLSQ